MFDTLYGHVRVFDTLRILSNGWSSRLHKKFAQNEALRTSVFDALCVVSVVVSMLFMQCQCSDIGKARSRSCSGIGLALLELF